MKKVLVPVANGTEELEAITIIDVLRRAGCKTLIASVNGLEVVTSHGVKLTADNSIADYADDTFDLIVLPGGMPGAENLANSEILIKMLQAQEAAGRYVAAICASPFVVFEQKGIAADCKKTCYPSMLDKMSNAVDEAVVVDRHCITSQGPGTAMEFSLKLVEILVSKEKADELAKGMLVG